MLCLSVVGSAPRAGRFTGEGVGDIIGTTAGGGDVMAQMGEVFVGEGAVRFGLEYRDDMSDQGVCVHALGDVDGREVELLRFDCFDHQPHYHYGPEKANERLMLDSTTEGDALEWVLAHIRTRLPDMVRRAGYSDVADGIDPESLESTLTDLAKTARTMARERRSTAVHDRGDTVLEAGPVRFGIEFRELGDDRGIAIHVLGDVGDEELELLTFDCFEQEPHYHYGPRSEEPAAVPGTRQRYPIPSTGR